MKDIIGNLNLTNDTIEIFLECLGKIPLSYEEIHAIKPHLSDDEFKIIFKELIKHKLIVNVIPEKSKLLNHYLAIPPFKAILNKTPPDKSESKSEDIELNTNVKNIILEIFNEKENPIELSSILNELKMMKQNFENDSSEIRKAIHKTLDDMQKRDDSALYYLNFEDNVKKSINAQFASILEIILQIDSQSDAIPGIKNLTREQWIEIRQDLKNFLAKRIHKKALELDQNISNNFREIKDYFGSKLAISMEEQIGQKAVDLGILKIVNEEISGLFEYIQSKDQQFKQSWTKLAEQIGKKLTSYIESSIEKNLEKFRIFEELLPEIIETYFKVDNIWKITSISKIKEEILNIIEQVDDEIIIIVPKIKDYIPLDAIKNSKKPCSIILIASDSHDSEIIAEIRTYPNVKYLRIKKNSIIGIKGAGILIIGYYNFNLKDLSKNINAIGITDETLINIFTPIINAKFMISKPPERVQMNINFNHINENIDFLEGEKISHLLQENLDIATNLKGISLNVLELKLLISKLKAIKSQISDNDFKQNIIEKIHKWNEVFTSLPLRSTPDLKRFELKEASVKEDVHEESRLISDLSLKSDLDNYSIEKIEPLFEILFEKIKDYKGRELSKIIQDAINTVLQIQGYSIITSWKDELSSEENKDKILENSLKEKFIKDFSEWKHVICNSMGADKVEPRDSQILSTGLKENNEQSIEKDILLAGYKSPGISQEQFDGQSTPIEESPIIDENQLPERIQSVYDDIFHNIHINKGIDISNKLQVLGDLLVEKHGYMATKDIRPWVARLKKIKDSLEDDIKTEFLNFLNQIKTKYIGEKPETTSLDDLPSFATLDDSIPTSDTKTPDEKQLSHLFDKILENSTLLNGYELTRDLQEIADIIMRTKGALSARAIRPWISRLRAIREHLEEDVKNEFIQFIEEMKEKLS